MQQNSNGYTYAFGVQLSNKDSGNVVRTNAKKPEVENSIWRPLNFNYVYLSLYAYGSNEIPTAMPMFWGPTIK